MKHTSRNVKKQGFFRWLSKHYDRIAQNEGKQAAAKFALLGVALQTEGKIEVDVSLQTAAKFAQYGLGVYAPPEKAPLVWVYNPRKWRVDRIARELTPTR